MHAKCILGMHPLRAQLTPRPRKLMGYIHILFLSIITQLSVTYSHCIANNMHLFYKSAFLDSLPAYTLCMQFPVPHTEPDKLNKQEFTLYYPTNVSDPRRSSKVDIVIHIIASVI